MKSHGGPHFSSYSGADRGKSRPPRPAFEYVNRMFHKELEAVPAPVREYVRESMAEVQFRTFGWANQDDYLRECMVDVQAVLQEQGPEVERADFGDVFVRFFDIVELAKNGERNRMDAERQMEADLRDIQREMRFELGGRLRGAQAHVGKSGGKPTRVLKKF